MQIATAWRLRLLAACVWLCGSLAPDGSKASDVEPVVPPDWLYPVNSSHGDAETPDGKAIRHVPHSRVSYTNEQVDDLFIAPDWHPDEHTTIPLVVSQGQQPDTYACGYCHRITGSGAPENAHLAGLPATYIRQQLHDFRSGARVSSLPARIPQAFMVSLAKSLTDDEIDDVARYFSELPPTPNLHVVETATVPSVHVANWALARDQRPVPVALGQRMLELPDDPQDAISRDSHARFTVYAPPKSLARGRALVQGNAAVGSIGCGACHGDKLKGSILAPPLVNQSPTYLLRQLVDLQQGARRGALATPMIAVARSLSIDDMIAVAAYAASLSPTQSAPLKGTPIRKPLGSEP